MTVKSKQSLDERIAAAFTDGGTRSDHVSQLIVEVEAAAAAADAAAKSGREEALDPALSPADVAAARREMEDAAFRRDRMQTAVVKLGERLGELRRKEEDKRRWIVYEKARAQRDKLAVELKEVYPSLAARLADLAARVSANDREIEHINTWARPSGAEGLAGAVLVARELKNFNDGTANVPSITAGLRLPGFDYHRRDPYTWPRSG